VIRSEQQELWIEIGSGGFAPNFQNGWLNFGAGFQTVAFYRDVFDRVHLKGLIKSGTIGQPAFTLPVSYRPASRCMYMVNSNAGVGRVDIYADGRVTVEQGVNTWAGLDGISFRAP
jgi:hypothetical protein